MGRLRITHYVPCDASKTVREDTQVPHEHTQTCVYTSIHTATQVTNTHTRTHIKCPFSSVGALTGLTSSKLKWHISLSTHIHTLLLPIPVSVSLMSKWCVSCLSLHDNSKITSIAQNMQQDALYVHRFHFQESDRKLLPKQQSIVHPNVKFTSLRQSVEMAAEMWGVLGQMLTWVKSLRAAVNLGRKLPRVLPQLSGHWQMLIRTNKHTYTHTRSR